MVNIWVNMGGGEHSVGTETKTDKPETTAQTKQKLILLLELVSQTGFHKNRAFHGSLDYPCSRRHAQLKGINKKHAGVNESDWPKLGH